MSTSLGVQFYLSPDKVGMRNAAEEVREVGVDDVPVSAEQQFFHLHRRLLGVAPGPVGVLFGWEIGFSR